MSRPRTGSASAAHSASDACATNIPRRQPSDNRELRPPRQKNVWPQRRQSNGDRKHAESRGGCRPHRFLEAVFALPALSLLEPNRHFQPPSWWSALSGPEPVILVNQGTIATVGWRGQMQRGLHDDRAAPLRTLSGEGVTLLCDGASSQRGLCRAYRASLRRAPGLSGRQPDW